jgi:hypothetical protein
MSSIPTQNPNPSAGIYASGATAKNILGLVDPEWINLAVSWVFYTILYAGLFLLLWSLLTPPHEASPKPVELEFWEIWHEKHGLKKWLENKLDESIGEEQYSLRPYFYSETACGVWITVYEKVPTTVEDEIGEEVRARLSRVCKGEIIIRFWYKGSVRDLESGPKKRRSDTSAQSNRSDSDPVAFNWEIYGIRKQGAQIGKRECSADPMWSRGH